MLSMSRAALVSLIIFFFSIGLVTSAPVSERISSLSARYDDYDSAFVSRSLGVRELDLADPGYLAREYLSLFDGREFDLEDHEFTKREYLPVIGDREFEELDRQYAKRDYSDLHMLYRRKSIFTKIKEGIKKLGRKIKSGFQKFGRKVKSGFQKFGKKVKAGFQKFGNKVKTGFKTFGRKVKAGFQKAGRVLKKGFQKVGKFIKKVAAKVAKVALKVVAAVGSVVAKVAKFIPGVGEPLSMAIKGAAMGANIASDKIHANIGKFAKFTNGLNYVISPVGSIAKVAAKGMAKKGGGAGKAGSVIADLLM